MSIELDSFRLYLRSEGKKRTTVDNYCRHLKAYERWLAGTSVTGADTSTLREFIAHERDRGMVDGTIYQRIISLRVFYRWLHEEGDISSNPSERLKLPRVRVPDISPISVEDVSALLREAKSTGGFVGVRDDAILRVLCDTGLRRAELLSMTVDGTDPNTGMIVIRRKGGKLASLPMGTKVSLAVARYLRLRSTRKGSWRPELWLATSGAPLGYSTVSGRLAVYATRAGLPPVHPHQLRHLWASEFRRNGGNDTELMTLAGWSSMSQVARYGRATAQERAMEAGRRLSLGDRL
jgi:site-specific recombinase XerD